MSDGEKIHITFFDTIMAALRGKVKGAEALLMASNGNDASISSLRYSFAIRLQPSHVRQSDFRCPHFAHFRPIGHGL